MPASAENESEILLGNKQLLAVFAVVAILLAVAFTGGYMLGKRSAEQKASAALEGNPQAATVESSGGPITQKLTPDDPPTAKPDSSKSDAANAKMVKSGSAPDPLPAPSPVSDTDQNILGKPKPQGTPKHGQSFVQVMAVTRKDAEATADVLRQHEFQARVAPAPGSTTVYRVLVGPAKDAGDLRNTEDALRKIGYTKCFVQHY